MTILPKWRKKQDDVPFYSTRAVPFINDEQIITELSYEELHKKIDETFYRASREHFEQIQTEHLRAYRAILRSQYEVWNTFDSNAHNAMSAFSVSAFSACLAFLFGTLNKSSSIFTIILFFVTLTFMMKYLFENILKNLFSSGKEISSKKEKAVLFLTIVDDILGERKK